MLIKISKGLDLQISGKPKQHIHERKPVTHIALLGEDYSGLKAKLLVKTGDRVKKGQAVFYNKQTQINYTSPACGVVGDIQFGEKHALTSLPININGDEEEVFTHYTPQQLLTLDSTAVKETLLASGLWTAFRTRPYSKNPDPKSTPHSVFVTAIDTNPLAVDPAVVLEEYKESFSDGMMVLSKLIDAPIYLCQPPDINIAMPDNPNIKNIIFKGSHPAGLVGTHIHYIDPVSIEKTVWHIHYQDVIAIGKLFTTGKLWTDRIISLAGTMVKQARLLKVSLGASLDELLKNELSPAVHRVISGSVLSGRQSLSNTAYLGRYHYQVTVIEEGHLNFNWQKINWLQQLLGIPKNKINTALNGQTVAMIPFEHFESVMPLDILPAPLLKALLMGDVDIAIDLGALELDEEDLALCTYLCSSKQDYGKALRACLNQIAAEAVS